MSRSSLSCLRGGQLWRFCCRRSRRRRSWTSRGAIVSCWHCFPSLASHTTRVSRARRGRFTVRTIGRDPVSVLEARGLTKRYGEKVAVEELSFTIQQGQIFGFLGPNGSGKTTTIGMIFGIIRPTCGEVSLFGGSNRAALAQGRMSGTLEQPNLYPYLTARENLVVVAGIKGLESTRIEPALAAVDMLESADREVKSYSLGMRQRLALAGAMLGD